MSRYSRNRIYLSEKEQEKLKNFPVLIAGCGVGSNIAECALRTGFEKICVIDGDVVEESNLNRQNYAESQTGKSKALSLCDRLKSINSEAEVSYIHHFITGQNIPDAGQYKAAINALDFNSTVPIAFDEKFLDHGIPVLHPYNLGWGGMVTVVMTEGPYLTDIAKSETLNEVKVVEYAAGCRRFWKKLEVWLESVLADIKTKRKVFHPHSWPLVPATWQRCARTCW